MPLNLINTDDIRVNQASDYMLECRTKNYTGIILYVDYIKGDESSIKFSFETKDDIDTTSNFYALTDVDGDVYNIVVTGTSKKCFQAPIPISVDLVNVGVEFVDSASPLTEGTINIIVRVDSIY